MFRYFRNDVFALVAGTKKDGLIVRRRVDTKNEICICCNLNSRRAFKPFFFVPATKAKREKKEINRSTQQQLFQCQGRIYVGDGHAYYSEQTNKAKKERKHSYTTTTTTK